MIDDTGFIRFILNQLPYLLPDDRQAITLSQLQRLACSIEPMAADIPPGRWLEHAPNGGMLFAGERREIAGIAGNWLIIANGDILRAQQRLLEALATGADPKPVMAEIEALIDENIKDCPLPDYPAKAMPGITYAKGEGYRGERLHNVDPFWRMPTSHGIYYDCSYKWTDNPAFWCIPGIEVVELNVALMLYRRARDRMIADIPNDESMARMCIAQRLMNNPHAVLLGGKEAQPIQARGIDGIWLCVCEYADWIDLSPDALLDKLNAGCVLGGSVQPATARLAAPEPVNENPAQGGAA